MTAVLRKLRALLSLTFTLLVRVPYWTITSLPGWNRPRRSWSLKRVILVRLFAKLVLVGDNEPVSPNHEAIQEGPGIKGVWVEPVPTLIKGDVATWAEEAGVQSERIPGYWLEKKGTDIPAGTPAKVGEKVFYALHGGAYTKMSAHPDTLIGTLHRGLLEHTQEIQRLFAVEYRLASRRGGVPVYPFPTQLIDAVAGYVYLVKALGFAPENIIVVGDSAGGNLTVALARYLAERKAAGDADIPDVPSALLLYSPWVDLEVREHDPSSSAIRNIPSDILNLISKDFITATSFFLGARPLSYAASNRYISPASQSPSMEPISFNGFPRTLIVCGEAETLLDQSHILHKKLVADLGAEQVQLIEWPDAVHDFCGFAWHEPERTEALIASTKWVETS